MKKVVFLILAGFMFVFTGCFNDDDGYSLNDVWVGFGIVEDSVTYKIVLDDGEVLIPVAFGGYGHFYENSHSGKPKEINKGDRVLVNFTILDDKLNEAGEVEAYYVKVNSVREILMKGILDITAENQDSIGNDPIIVEEYWVTNNLLNMELKYWGQNEVHFINLVKKPGALTAAGQPFELELRHNSNDDTESVPYTALVSFKLDSLQIAGIDSVRFTVKSTDYDGKAHEFNEVYKYVKNN